jgi:hypothetical protein
VVSAHYLKVMTPGTDNIACLLVEAQLNDNLQEKLYADDKALVLQNANRVLWNLVPDDGTPESAKISTQLWTASNHLQNNELLGGHSAVSYLINNDSVTNSLFTNAGTRIRETLFM